MSLRWKDDATRSKQLDLSSSLAQLLARSFAHLIDPIGNHRHNGERADMTARIDQLIGSTKIGTSTRLGQRLPRVEQPRAHYCPLSQKPGDRMVGAASLTDRGKAVHQAVSQVVRRGQGNLCWGIRDVSRT